MREKVKLILTVGLPRSGKTTWAREYSGKHGIPVVSPDEARKRLCGVPFRAEIEGLVWFIVETTVAMLAEYHNTIILDATNVTNARRDRWSYDYTVQLAIFETPVGLCIDRAEKGNRHDLVPVIKQMFDEWEKPDPAHEVIYHYTDRTGKAVHRQSSALDDGISSVYLPIEL